ncbi:MarR family transcriptional regulator [Asticcacaulis sp.]|uniref:MarR family winged helix-turn-helix transcriptional regulator n=1 Tax=Asticcacaulis sp. TaxID=1872648 RepID=UPI002C38BA2C|nr:MarR family transcriptional regulator [Asticcacaulis sp.]HTM81100.1 MarR family transcriptional regulator [Asticcacaulis sp.]
MTTPVEPSHLTSHLGYWLRYVSNHVSYAFARKLEDRGVTVAEWVMLRELYGVNAIAPSRLSEQMGMTRGAITKLADRLIAKALITRNANPQDARAQTLELTPSGRDLVPELSALADRNDAEFFGHLTPDERQSLERVLKDIVARRGLTSSPIN